ncbi:organic hydroperoxide resistance protein [Sphingobium sp.]|uniref:organic hydroperoxide resistance protein n=1 Tax=Sphingobium sp. TaxID=1912891 RepID=UPI002CC6DEC9|nr:organic hydroperoxide resistance protein [Sphingobium sp.]HUD92237.1 organic hydroperoxide resistance protein [Sphingobium sp.]
MPVDSRYSASATAIGGRDGRVTTPDNVIDLATSTPRELGGEGAPDATNPEQLFAAGYSACFLSAMKLVAQQRGLTMPDETTVRATVGIGPHSQDGFGLVVSLAVQVPGVDRASAEQVAQDAHQQCPYSHATRNNVDVVISII